MGGGRGEVSSRTQRTDGIKSSRVYTPSGPFGLVD